MSTYSIGMSGPSPRMAWLRALVQKMAETAQSGWIEARSLIGGAAQLGRTTATTVIGLVGTPASYDTVVAVTRASVTASWRLALRAAGWAGRLLGTAASAVRTTLARVSPRLAGMLTQSTKAVTAPARAGAGAVRRGVETTGQLTLILARTDLVRTATTRAAQLAALLIGIHALTEGVAAAHAVQVLPWTVHLVNTATNPTRALLFVAGTALAAAVVALAQLLRRSARQPQAQAQAQAKASDAPETTAETCQSDDAAPDEAQVLTDLAVIARTVTVEVHRDGSITVSGIPDTVPADLGQVVAEIAVDAALRQLRRTLRLRPTPNRDDRRLFTKAARDAIRAEAARRRGQAA